MAQRRTVQTATRAFAFLVLATPIILSASPFSVHAQDVIANAQTPPQLVREEPAPAATLPPGKIDVIAIVTQQPPIVTDPISLDPSSPLPDRPPLDRRSRQCTAHTDCVLVTDNCGVMADAVNKALIVNWKAANFNISSNCRPIFGPGELAARQTPVCLNNTCGLMPHVPGQPVVLPPVLPPGPPVR